MTPELTKEEFLDYLKNPILFPTAFKDYIADYFATNIPKLPVSQVFGFKLHSVKDAAEVTALDAITSSTYAAAGTPGPSLDHIPNGFYIMLFGATFGSTSGIPWYGYGQEIWMSPVLDGAAAIDNNAAVLNAGSNGRVLLIDFTTGNGAHTVNMHYKYVTASGNAVWNRWLYLLKVVNE